MDRRGLPERCWEQSEDPLGFQACLQGPETRGYQETQGCQDRKGLVADLAFPVPKESVVRTVSRVSPVCLVSRGLGVWTAFPALPDKPGE